MSSLTVFPRSLHLCLFDNELEGERKPVATRSLTFISFFQKGVLNPVIQLNPELLVINLHLLGQKFNMI